MPSTVQDGQSITCCGSGHGNRRSEKSFMRCGTTQELPPSATMFFHCRKSATSYRNGGRTAPLEDMLLVFPLGTLYAWRRSRASVC
jgi:hypothetical protein